MNLFAGKITIQLANSRSNFDSLIWAFCTVYQIISLEQWQYVIFLNLCLLNNCKFIKVYHLCLASRSDEWVVHIYFFSLIFFGSFVLKNVFLAGVLGIFQIARNSMKRRRIKAINIIKKLKFTQR